MFTLNFFIKVFMLTFSNHKVVAIIKSGTFQKYLEHGKVQSSFDMSLGTSLAVCAAKCSQKETECAAFNYNAIKRQCELIADNPTTIASDLLTQHDDWNVYYTQALPPCIPSYTILTATGEPKVITSPNYPDIYNKNPFKCPIVPEMWDDVYWLIVKPSVTSRLVVRFIDMEVEYHSTCDWDSVSFYRGECTDDELITRVCGSGTPSFEEDNISLYVLVHFYTDGRAERTGFALEYYIA